MNVYAWVLLGALAVLAVTSWVASRSGSSAHRSGVERMARPAYLLVLAALAWLFHADQTSAGLWILAGLGFAFVAALLVGTGSDVAFGFGMLAALSARLAYLGAVLLTDSVRPPLWYGVGGTVVALALVALVVLRPLVGRSTAEAVGPTVYVVLLAAFVGTAWWHGDLVAAVGASLLALGDGLTAAVRFWRDDAFSRVLATAAYQAGSLLVVAGLLRPDIGSG